MRNEDIGAAPAAISSLVRRVSRSALSTISASFYVCSGTCMPVSLFVFDLNCDGN